MFIKYEKSQAKKVIKKKIGINLKGRIVFYKNMKEDLENPYFVNLLFDDETNRIGIKPIKREDTAFFRIQGTSTRFIYAKRFFNHFGIHPEGRFDYTVEDGMLVVQLPKGEE